MTHSGPPSTPNPRPEGDAPADGRSETLGATLLRARERLDLDLSDVAEVTHVRREYLKALEEGRYDALPEDVYARNFLRLYAQTVGLDHTPLLERYKRERSRALGAPPPAPVAGRAAPADPAAPARATDRDADRDAERRGLPDLSALPALPPALRNLGPLLLAGLVFVGLVAGAVWVFNANFFTAGRTPPPVVSDAEPGATDAAGGEANPGGLAAPIAPGDTGTDPGAGDGLANPALPPADATPEVALTITSDPPGARVMVDNFVLPGTTPIVAERITARDQRVVTVSREGYVTHEQTYDLTADRTLDVALTPVGAAIPVEAADDDGATPEGGGGAGGALASDEIEINVTGETWLEIYPSNARGVGEPLVYTTAQPGQSYTFSAPLFVRVGNAGGVEIRRGDGTAQPLGSNGEVVDRIFSP